MNCYSFLPLFSVSSLMLIRKSILTIRNYLLLILKITVSVIMPSPHIYVNEPVAPAAQLIHLTILNVK